MGEAVVRTRFFLPFYRDRSRLGLACIILSLLVAGGCATSPPPASLPAASGIDDGRVTQMLRTEIQSWLGTPHRLGGMSRRGTDCSGLVVAVYASLFDLRLPRTTTGLIRAGQPVDKKRLASGDLVFFKPGFKTRHVGIYLGGGAFVHASTSRGVIISRLDGGFWGACYIAGRRVL